MKQPAQATHMNEGLFFKIGVHGKLFFWAFDEWRLSSRPAFDIKTMRKIPQPGETHDYDLDDIRDIFQSE